MYKIGSIHEFLHEGYVVVPKARHTMTIGHCPSCKPAGPGHSPGGDPEGKAAGSSENPAFYSAKQRPKSHSSDAFSLVCTPYKVK